MESPAAEEVTEGDLQPDEGGVESAEPSAEPGPDSGPVDDEPADEEPDEDAEPEGDASSGSGESGGDSEGLVAPEEFYSDVHEQLERMGALMEASFAVEVVGTAVIVLLLGLMAIVPLVRH